jgi:hypothetical protein
VQYAQPQFPRNNFQNIELPEYRFPVAYPLGYNNQPSNIENQLVPQPPMNRQISNGPVTGVQQTTTHAGLYYNNANNHFAPQLQMTRQISGNKQQTNVQAQALQSADPPKYYFIYPTQTTSIPQGGFPNNNINIPTAYTGGQPVANYPHQQFIGPTQQQTKVSTAPQNVSYNNNIYQAQPNPTGLYPVLNPIAQVSHQQNRTIILPQVENGLTPREENILRMEQESRNEIIHKIEQGDSIEGLALQYSVSPVRIRNYNNLTTNDIYYLKEIRIPDPGKMKDKL